METLIYDNKKPIIWQNDNQIFIIKKHNSWNWCIEVKFDYYKDVNYINLFLIFKSFLLDISLYCYAITSTYIDKKNNILISENLSIKRFKKIKFDDFIEWYENRITSDKKYEISDEFISLVFHFEKNIIKLKNIELDNVSPKFPWNEKMISFLNEEELNIEKLKNKIKKLEKRIKEIEK